MKGTATRALLLGILLLGSVGNVAAVNAPHHPLSQIYPMDVPLNLSGQPIVDNTDSQVDVQDALSVQGNLDMNGNEILGQVVEPRSTAPGSPSAGQLYFDTDQNVLKYYNGSTWVITASADQISSDLESVLETGNTAGSHDINMTGSSIHQVNQLTATDSRPTYLSPNGRGVMTDLQQTWTYHSGPGGLAQNNWYRLDQQGGVTVTVEDSAGNTWTDPAALFNDPGDEFRVDTANMPVNITMDFGSDEHYNGIGAIGYRYGRRAKDITIRVQSDDGSWSTLIDKNDYMGNTQVWPSWGSHNQKFKITLSDPSDAAINQGYIRISNLFQTKTTDPLRRNPGGALVYEGGDSMYGNLNMQGNSLRDAGQVDFASGAYIDEGTADYGDIRVGGRCESGWCGVNIEGQSDYVFMTDESGTDDVGIYADDPNQWLWRYDSSANHIDSFKNLDMNGNLIGDVSSLAVGKGSTDSGAQVIDVNGIIDADNWGSNAFGIKTAHNGDVGSHHIYIGHWYDKSVKESFGIYHDNTENPTFNQNNAHYRFTWDGTATAEGGWNTASDVDLAEIFLNYTGNPKPGNIITMREDGNLSVSTSPYQQQVIGVVSTDPGILLGASLGADSHLGQTEEGLPVAMEGRVPVNVTTRNGPIEPGDRIVPSPFPGYGMVCQFQDEMNATNLTELKTISKHNRQCRTSAIGKAKEPLTEGNGTITVVLN